MYIEEIQHLCNYILRKTFINFVKADRSNRAQKIFMKVIKEPIFIGQLDKKSDCDW